MDTGRPVFLTCSRMALASISFALRCALMWLSTRETTLSRSSLCCSRKLRTRASMLMYFEASNVALDNVTDWLSFSICVQVQLEDTRGPEKEMRSSPSTGSHARGRQDLPEVGRRSSVRRRDNTLEGGKTFRFPEVGQRSSVCP